MTTFTSRGIPILEATDSADIPARVNPLAQLFHDRPGIATLTATQRNALAGAELWHGRVIVNTTIDRLQRYQLSTNTWFDIADFSEIAALLATTGTPLANGTASRGTSGSAARSDHVHPVPTFATYATTWTTAGSAPAINNGTLTTRWQQNGKNTTINFQMAMGSTTAYGGDVWRFSLPATTQAPAGTYLGGQLHAVDATGLSFTLFARTVTTSTFELVFHSITTAGALAATASGAAPFSWAVNDTIRGHLFYEAA